MLLRSPVRSAVNILQYNKQPHLHIANLENNSKLLLLQK